MKYPGEANTMEEMKCYCSIVSNIDSDYQGVKQMFKNLLEDIKLPFNILEFEQAKYPAGDTGGSNETVVLKRNPQCHAICLFLKEDTDVEIALRHHLQASPWQLDHMIDTPLGNRKENLKKNPAALPIPTTSFRLKFRIHSVSPMFTYLASSRNSTNEASYMLQDPDGNDVIVERTYTKSTATNFPCPDKNNNFESSLSRNNSNTSTSWQEKSKYENDGETCVKVSNNLALNDHQWRRSAIGNSKNDSFELNILERDLNDPSSTSSNNADCETGDEAYKIASSYSRKALNADHQILDINNFESSILEKESNHKLAGRRRRRWSKYEYSEHELFPHEAISLNGGDFLREALENEGSKNSAKDDYITFV